MQHRGEIVEKAIRDSGFSITHLAEKLGKSRRWMYLAFENPDLSIELVLEIGAIIHHDFSDDIKGLAKYRQLESGQTAREPKRPISQKENDPEYWKNKYLDLLEQHNLLLSDKVKKKYPTTRKSKKK